MFEAVVNTRERWAPGAGGMCLHTVLVDPADPRQMHVAISAAGFFSSEDGGATWQPRNKNVRADLMPETYPEVGQCVHKVQSHPSWPEVLYQQNHCGVYRSENAGRNWTDVSEGLPSRFGFPLAVHSHEPRTIYVVPQTSQEIHWTCEGAMRVYRSRSGGDSWEPLTTGLPQRNAFLSILREGLAVDHLDPCGVYVGTNTGQLFASWDEGQSWDLVEGYLPGILSVTAVTF